MSTVSEQNKDQILRTLRYQLGELPVRYLRVPVIPTKLKKSDCMVLVEKITNRINPWKNKVLSYGGRIQLIMSVLSNIQIFSRSRFIFPKNVLKKISKIFKNFLWQGNEHSHKGAKVARSFITKPKTKGELGFKDLVVWNNALNSKHIWRIFTERGKSLGVEWI